MTLIYIKNIFEIATIPVKTYSDNIFLNRCGEKDDKFPKFAGT